MDNELIYMMALSQASRPTCAVKNELLNQLGSATAIYHEHRDLLDPLLAHCEQELLWAQKNRIQCISILDEAYPQRLRQCADAPLILFYRGNADLNAPHIVSMVGTRKISEYGKQMCDRFVHELTQLVPDVVIFSGLAYGVDVHSHRAALQYGAKTIGVLAHGLDQIYPTVHRDTAARMLSQGGLLTEYPSGTQIDKRNFVQRNRIVAGCSQATIVVESAAKGGSLITAEMAQDYSREVFAIPGRLTDPVSAGCNKLISQNEASVLLSAQQFVEAMGWEHEQQLQRELQKGIQQDMFPNLDPEQQKIVNALQGKDRLHLNELATTTAIPIGKLSGLLFSMEMAGIVKMMPGSSYRLT